MNALAPSLSRFATVVATCVLLAGQAFAADPLPSWKEGPNKQAILDFVRKTTDQSGSDYVAPADRVATFDNDGTLWVEHPMYTQLAFALDRIKALVPQHPEWKTTMPFKALLDGDLLALAASGEKGLLQLVMATHAGMSTAALEAEAKKSGWHVISMKEDWARIFDSNK